jgi:hypothetical protein
MLEASGGEAAAIRIEIGRSEATQLDCNQSAGRPAVGG